MSGTLQHLLSDAQKLCCRPVFVLNVPNVLTVSSVMAVSSVFTMSSVSSVSPKTLGLTSRFWTKTTIRFKRHRTVHGSSPLTVCVCVFDSQPTMVWAYKVSPWQLRQKKPHSKFLSFFFDLIFKAKIQFPTIINPHDNILCSINYLYCTIISPPASNHRRSIWGFLLQ